VRLFFALWPSPTRRQALAAATARAVSQVDGRAVPPANLHVTLAFLGAVPADRLPELVLAGGQGGHRAFEFDFDRLEYWPKPKVVVAMASAAPAAGVELVEQLWQRLEPLGFPREQRPWQPHMTLVRKIRRPPPDGLRFDPLPAGSVRDPTPWGLALVESVTHPDGARYRPLAEWPPGS
jgi:2'-5' RNA ligase